MRLAAPVQPFRIALLACALGFGACGGEPDPSIEHALGAPMRTATCADWERADIRSRRDALEELRQLRHDQISGRDAGRGYGSVLNDNLAYGLLEKRCQLRNSESYQLYKLYSFAAGFAGEAP